MLNIIDLFSGAGGLTEGFRNTEIFNLIAHVEMDPSASKTLKLRDAYYYLKEKNNLDLYYDYITKKISSDIFFSKIPKHVVSKIINVGIGEDTIHDIFSIIDCNKGSNKVHGVIGGPPCQAYSTIGRSQNSKIKEQDERIYLYKYYIKFLERYDPDFFIFENVKGLLSFKDLDGQKLLDKIISEFSDVNGTDHYIIEKKMINCADYGVPQTRERLFIFGQKKKRVNENFFNWIEKYKETPPVINCLFQDLPFIKAGQIKNEYSSTPADTFVKENIRKNNVPLTQNICRPNKENDLAIYKIVAKEKILNKNVRYSDLPPHLITHKKTNIFLDRFKAISGTGFCHTVVAHISKDGHYYIHPDVNQNRSITVREAARIQTFPDDFYFEDSRTAAFKQIGNAVPPFFSKIVSKSIYENLYKKEETYGKKENFIMS